MTETTTIPTLTTTDEAHALLRELAETHEWVSVFWDRGWGDSGQVAEISIIVGGNGQQPKAWLTPEVYRELRERKLIAPNSLKTYKARRVHNFKTPPPPDTTEADRRREASEQVIRRLLADMADVPVRVEFYRGLDPDSRVPRSMHPSDPPTDETSQVILGRALLTPGGDVWPGTQPGLWRIPGGHRSYSTHEAIEHSGAVREVLLVPLAAGKVLDAAQEIADAWHDGLDAEADDADALVAAWDAMVDDTPTEPSPAPVAADLTGRCDCGATDHELSETCPATEPVPVPDGDGLGWLDRIASTLAPIWPAIAAEVRDARAELAEVTSRAEAAERERETQVNIAGEVRRELAEVTADRDRLQRNVDTLLSDRRRPLDDHELCEQQLREARGGWRETAEELAEIKVERHGLREQRDAARTALEQAAAEQAAHEGELGDMRSQLSAAEAEVDRLERVVAAEHASHAESRSEVERLRYENEGLRSDLAWHCDARAALADVLLPRFEGSSFTCNCEDKECHDDECRMGHRPDCPADCTSPCPGLVDRILATARRDAEVAVADAAHLRDLVADLTDPDPCQYDHERFCQAHSLHSAPCPHERARDLLDIPVSEPAEDGGAGDGAS